MQHLVWEIMPVSGKQHCRQPSYGVVTVDSITQRACMCVSTYVCVLALPCRGKGFPRYGIQLTLK